MTTTLLSVTEAATRLNVSTKTIRRWIEAGELPAVRLPGPGRRLRIDPLDLDACLRTA